MPQLGSDSKPLILKNQKSKNKKLGLSGKFYTKENQKKYEEGWDRIFKKKKKRGRPPKTRAF